jgi:hypothetical protein
MLIADVAHRRRPSQQPLMGLATCGWQELWAKSACKTARRNDNYTTILDENLEDEF